MAAERCAVSFVDSDGLPHIAHLQAESLYEAVALAVAQFRDDPMVEGPGPLTESRSLLNDRLCSTAYA